VKTPSSNRIIGAEQLSEVRPFTLSDLQGLRTGAARVGFSARAAASEPEPPKEDDPAFVAGRALGLREGVRQGAEAAQQRFAREHAQARAAELARLESRASGIADAFEEQLGALRTGLADEVVELAIELARQTVRRALLTDRGLIVDVAREAMAALIDEHASFSLHLNPADVQEVESALDAALRARSARVVPDPAIAVGGCRIVSSGAEVDATVDTRWRRTLAAIGRPDAAYPDAVDVTRERLHADAQEAARQQITPQAAGAADADD
jgi:flagellar assembly protein FliH